MARQFRSNTRMVKAWDGMAGQANAITASSTFLASGLLNFAEPFTILRMLGEYTIGPTSAPAALDNADVTIGIGVVSTDAATLGATALPDPADEPEFPWLYWASHDFFFAGTGAQPAIEVAGLRRSFDIKSMRKVKPRESLIVVGQYTDRVGAPPLQINVQQTRVLLAVH